MDHFGADFRGAERGIRICAPKRKGPKPRQFPNPHPRLEGKVGFLVPLPDRRQRRPSSFQSATTTAIPSRSVTTVAVLSRSTTTAAILLPICDDSGHRRQRPSSFRSATTAAIPSRSAMMAAIFFRLATAAASPPPDFYDILNKYTIQIQIGIQN
ncbi:hypothetical protein Taro_004739 [Colocasia esculenta]|uniref:Uncharacterized protein n=1 Tax=Colocasia esculenta TaxID=4460 RepID=A0A843TQZ8_COLES|nr:hypothetical protein [Colocasia esculenta]